MPSFLYTRSIPFHETDAAGIVHFSRMLCLVEEAEHAALASLGIPVFSEAGGWPRVKLDVDYQSPLRLGDVAEITVSVQRVGRSSVSWQFVITCGSNPVRSVAKGSMVTVFVGPEGKPQDLGEWRQLLEASFSSDESETQ